MATQVESLIVELDANTSGYDTKMRGVEKTNITVNKSVAGIGRSAGMAGIQLQQFVGQIQGGQSAMLALSQQSADLGFVLGAPLLGAVTGIAASLAGILLPELFATNEEIKNLESNTESLVKKFTTLTEKQKEIAIAGLQEDLKKQTEQFAKLTGEAKELEQELSNSKFLSKQGGILNFFSDIEGDAEALASTNAALATTEIKIQSIANQLKNLSSGNVEGAELDPASKKADEERRDIELKALADHFIREAAIRVQLETEANESRLERELAFIEAANEIKFTGLETDEELFFKQQELHQALLDNKLISEEQFFKAQAKIAKDFAKGEVKLDKVKQSNSKQNFKLEEQRARQGMQLASLVFEDNKAVSSGIALVNTALGVTKALSKQDYAGAALTALIGAAQIAAINSASRGGGSISGSPSSPPQQQQQQQDFAPETSSLEVTEQSEGVGITTQRIIISTDDGTDIFDGLAKGLDDRARNGG